MQLLSCSRPFASQAQPIRAASQITRVGILTSPAQPRQQLQRQQAQAAISFSSSLRGCSSGSFSGTVLPTSTAIERQRNSGAISPKISRRLLVRCKHTMHAKANLHLNVARLVLRPSLKRDHAM